MFMNAGCHNTLLMHIITALFDGVGLNTGTNKANKNYCTNTKFMSQAGCSNYTIE
jgi:hypothetical protein